MKRKDGSGSKLGFCTRENRGGDSSDTSIIDLQSNRLQLNFNHQSSIKSRSPTQLFRLVSVFLYIYSCVYRFYVYIIARDLYLWYGMID